MRSGMLTLFLFELAFNQFSVSTRKQIDPCHDFLKIFSQARFVLSRKVVLIELRGDCSPFARKRTETCEECRRMRMADITIIVRPVINLKLARFGALPPL